MTPTVALLQAAAGLAFGGAFGTVYFRMLSRAVQRYVADGRASAIIPLVLGRIVLAAAAFWLIAQAGALPLLFAVIGFLIARTVVQRRQEAE